MVEAVKVVSNSLFFSNSNFNAPAALMQSVGPGLIIMVLNPDMMGVSSYQLSSDHGGRDICSKTFLKLKHCWCGWG